jgi:uncharacterized protein (TIGR02001 family)
MPRNLAFVVCLALALPIAAHAADQRRAPQPAASGGSPFYHLLTIEGATDYIPRGMSLSDHRPTLKGKVEVGYSAMNKFMVYGFASVINVAVGDTTREIDLAVGGRPHVSPQLVDLGVVHYVFDGSLPGFSEVYAGAMWPFPSGLMGQRLQLMGVGFWRTDNGNTYFEGNLGYILHGQAAGPVLVPRLEISGRVGAVNSALNYLTYGGALTYYFLPGVQGLQPRLLGELRYTASTATRAQCGDLCDQRVMFTLKYETPVSAILASLHH